MSWRATKLILVLIFCLVPVGFAVFQAFTGLVLGYALTIDDGPMDPGGYVYGVHARAYGAFWLILALILSVFLVRQFRRGLKEGGAG